MSDFDGLPKNVQAAINGLGAECKIYDHRKFLLEIRSPSDFAAMLGYPTGRLTKTLFLRSHDGQAYVAAVCSIDRRANFKAIARAIGVNRVEVASPDELQVKTGYPRNGVSALGLSRDISVLVDSTLLDYPTVLIGGGVSAIEVEIPPADLVRVSRARVIDMTSVSESLATSPVSRL